MTYIRAEDRIDLRCRQSVRTDEKLAGCIDVCRPGITRQHARCIGLVVLVIPLSEGAIVTGRSVEEESQLHSVGDISKNRRRVVVGAAWIPAPVQRVAY